VDAAKREPSRLRFHYFVKMAETNLDKWVKEQVCGREETRETIRKLNEQHIWRMEHLFEIAEGPIWGQFLKQIAENDAVLATKLFNWKPKGELQDVDIPKPKKRRL
jgi:hypothetical protein